MMADQDQERLKGGMGQQDPKAKDEAAMTGGANQGYGQTGFSPEAGQSGQVSNQSAGQSSDEGSGAMSGGALTPGLDANDQASGSAGLGQNQTGYGGATQQDTTGGQGHQQANLGAQGQTGHLGPAPGPGQGQLHSNTTGGADLSKGLSDQNRGGGGI
jgi:hypothetical protein